MSRLQFLSLGCFLVAPSIAFAQESEDTADDNQEQIELLVEQQNKLADEYNAILRKIKEDERLTELNKTIAAARAELAKAEAGNQALSAARRKEQDVRDAVRLAVEEKLKEHAEGGQLLARIEELKLKRADHLWQIELAQFQLNHALSPVNRALAGDKELATAKALLDAAGIEDRSDAKAAYDELREKKLEDIVEAQRLFAVIEDSAAAAQRLLESTVAVEERLTPIRKQIERIESKRIEAARAEVAAALNTDDIVELRKAVNEAVTQYNELITKLVAEDEEAVRLKAEYDKVRAEIKDLRAASQ